MKHAKETTVCVVLWKHFIIFLMVSLQNYFKVLPVIVENEKNDCIDTVITTTKVNSFHCLH